MLSADLVIATGVAYVGLLFLIAYVSDRRARRGKQSFLRSPFVYTLAISVYCTSWTFYGAVGSAARNGLEYLAIYLGPTLVFIGWWFVLRRLVRISHNQRITSIADLLSSRFGKSSRLAVLVTVTAAKATAATAARSFPVQVLALVWRPVFAPVFTPPAEWSALTVTSTKSWSVVVTITRSTVWTWV